MKKNIGLFFGSFNPIHNGHTDIANYFLKNSCLENIWFIISPSSPFKINSNILDKKYRLEMINLAIENIPNIEVSDIEFFLPTPNYTFITLEKLRKDYPNYNFTLIIGEDNYTSFNKWKNYTYILNHHNIFVYPREGEIHKSNLTNKKITFFENATFFDISSTYIRSNLSTKKTINSINEKVLNYINDKKLYL